MRCSSCGKRRPSTEFTAGHRACNGCRAAQQAEWQKGKGAEYHRQRQREFRGDSHGRRVERAHSHVARKVMTGELKKPPGCKVCGAGPVQAHHPDHGKAGDVAWLCPKHHRAEQ